MPKKILIVSTSFYPLNSPRSFRTTELVKEFSRQGHDLTIVTPKDQKIHAKFEEDYNVKIIDLKLKKNATFRYTGNIKIISLLKRVLNRLLQVLFEYPDIQIFFKLKNSLKGLNNFDLLISIATPHQVHWGISRVWRKKKTPLAKKWIADCGDPFMGATLETFKKMFYFKYVEKWWCDKVDHITVPFDGAKNAYYKEFHDKISVIPQGFNFEKSQDGFTKYNKNIIPTFAYAGSFIPNGRDPQEFIEYLLELDLDFKFIIFTNNKNLVEQYLEKAKGKIEVRNYMPRKDLLLFLSQMDFVLNINNSISTQSPSKLIDYYLTKRPILSIDSKDFNKNTVDLFLNGNYSEQLVIDNVDQYRIENVCTNFLNLGN